MEPKELGSKYFKEFIRLNKFGAHCKYPFNRVRPVDVPKKFLKLLVDLDEMISEYDERGYTDDDLKTDYCDLIDTCKIYQNDNVLVGICYKSILIFDGVHYIKTDNFNQEGDWYFVF